MNPRHVEFVVAVAREESFSRAAQRCHVTQPTLSNGISMLERELGGALFVRTTRKVSLSTFGEHMLPMIEALHQAHRETRSAALGYFEPGHQVVRIGLSPLVDVRRVNELLAGFRSEFPKCEIFFKECFLEDLSQHLSGTHLDLGVQPRQPNRRVGKALRQVPIYEEEIYYLPRASVASTPRSGSAVTLRDIADDQFVLGPDGCGLAAFTRDLFKKAGRQLQEYPGQALSYHVMQEWAESGIVSAILPASKLTPNHLPRALRITNRRGVPQKIAVDVVWKSSTASPKHILALHRHVKKVSADNEG